MFLTRLGPLITEQNPTISTTHLKEDNHQINDQVTTVIIEHPVATLDLQNIEYAVKWPKTIACPPEVFHPTVHEPG